MILGIAIEVISSFSSSFLHIVFNMAIIPQIANKVISLGIKSKENTVEIGNAYGTKLSTPPIKLVIHITK